MKISLSELRNIVRSVIAESYGEEETYSSSAEGVMISRKRAIQELEHHGVIINYQTMQDFYEALGKKDQYNAGDVLRWLGY